MPQCIARPLQLPRMSAASRHARAWPALAALAGIALTVSLGLWQLGRGQEKRVLAMQVERLAQEPPIAVSDEELTAAAVEQRRVEARGVFEPKYMVLIDNRIWHRQPGYHVVMPLRLGSGGRYVLVNRGWVAADADRSRLPQVKTPLGTQVVSGRAIAPGRFLELSEEVTEGPVWQNLTLERYRKAMPIAIQPFIIQQDNVPAFDDGLVRDWPAPDLGVEKHYGYAFQWFALSALILALYVIAHVRRKREA